MMELGNLSYSFWWKGTRWLGLGNFLNYLDQQCFNRPRIFLSFWRRILFRAELGKCTWVGKRDSMIMVLFIWWCHYSLDQEWTKNDYTKSFDFQVSTYVNSTPLFLFREFSITSHFGSSLPVSAKSEVWNLEGEIYDYFPGDDLEFHIAAEVGVGGVDDGGWVRFWEVSVVKFHQK